MDFEPKFFVPKSKLALDPKVHCWISRRGFVLIRRDRMFRLIATYSAAFRYLHSNAQVAQIVRASQEMIMKRRQKAGEGSPKPHAHADQLAEHVPCLEAWFTDSTFDDGSPRKGGWGCLWASNGSWRMRLKDDQEGSELELAAPSLLELIQMAEGAIADTGTPWRPILGWQEPGPAKKRKR